MQTTATAINDPILVHALLIYIGIVAGFFGSMLGLGGGWLIVPALQVLGVPPLKAVGTSLTAMIFTSSIGATRYYLRKILLLSLGLVIGVPAIGGVYLGKYLLALLNRYGYAGTMLLTAFILLLTGLGVSMLISARGKGHKEKKSGVRWRPVGPAITLKDGSKAGILNAGFLGFAAGTLSGLLGIGGGILLTPAMVTLFGVPVVQAASASLVSVFMSSLLGSTLYWHEGNTLFYFAVSLAAGTSVGSLLGARTAPRISEQLLKRVFGTLTLLTAATLIAREFIAPEISVAGILLGSTVLLIITFVKSGQPSPDPAESTAPPFV
jgi:hypothetical protein